MSKKNAGEKIAEFVRNTRVEERLRIEPAEGRTSEEIFALLEADSVQVAGDQLLLRRGEDDCSEGFTVLGKVLHNSRVDLPKCWKHLNGRKMKGGAPSEKPAKAPAVASLSEDETTPSQQHAHTCNPIGSVEHLKFQADQLRYRSEQAMQQADCDLSQVSRWLSAAEALIMAAGAFNSVEGVWLLAAQALLADKRGKVEDAKKLLDLAVKRSTSHLGFENAGTVVLVGNYGQYLVEHGDRSGITILEATLARLERVKPVANFTQSWIDGARAEFAGTLAKAQQTIAAYYGKGEPSFEQPPVAEAVCDAEAEFPELYGRNSGFGFGELD